MTKSVSHLWQDVRKKIKVIQVQNVIPHLLFRGSYDEGEGENMTSTTSEDVTGIIYVVSPHSRH